MRKRRKKSERRVNLCLVILIKTNKLETFEDALFKGSKTSTNKTEKLDAPMRKSVCGKGQELVIFEWIMS